MLQLWSNAVIEKDDRENTKDTVSLGDSKGSLLKWLLNWVMRIDVPLLKACILNANAIIMAALLGNVKIALFSEDVRIIVCSLLDASSIQERNIVGWCKLDVFTSELLQYIQNV